ncbi:MAG: GNAT family N-acetyltransferase [Candidatus Thorarchaeota archaeon]
MLETEVRKFGEIDVQEVAKFTFDVRQNSDLRNKMVTLEGMIAELKLGREDDADKLAILARDTSGRLKGWLSIYTGFSGIHFIGAWQPIIHEGRDQESIATALIKRAIRNTEEAGIRRLEALFDNLTEDLREFCGGMGRWYENNGMHLTTEELRMVADLKSLHVDEVSLPAGISAVSVAETTNTELERPFFETFLDGKDRLFLDLAHENQHVAFNWWFERERPFNEEASLVLKKGDDVAGFCIVRPGHESASIGPFGIHPDHQRKGLGKALLAKCLGIMIRQGLRTVELEMDMDNTPAFNLYSRFGFESIHSTVYYTWKAQ